MSFVTLLCRTMRLHKCTASSRHTSDTDALYIVSTLYTLYSGVTGKFATEFSMVITEQYGKVHGHGHGYGHGQFSVVQNYKQLVSIVIILWNHGPKLVGFGICDEGKLSPSLIAINFISTVPKN